MKVNCADSLQNGERATTIWTKLIRNRVKYLLNNSDLEFVYGLLINVAEGDIVDVRIRTGRSNLPLHWEHPPFELHRDGNAASLTFQRPTNAPRIEITVIGTRETAFSVAMVRLTQSSTDEVRRALAGKSIAFLGLARNCGEAGRNSVHTMARLGSLFGASTIHIAENDSSDNTADILRELESDGALTLHSFSNLDASLPKRTERLAFLRNYLTQIATSIEGVDYICWADMDGYLDETFDEVGFLTNFVNEAVWDAVFPVMNGFYYDVWALRHSRMWPEDCLVQINSVWDMALGTPVAQQAPVYTRQIAAQHMVGWLPVDSAFGGMGIYKANACRLGRYVGLIDDTEVCEHVLFHKTMVTNGAKLWINPKFNIRCVLDRPPAF